MYGYKMAGPTLVTPPASYPVTFEECKSRNRLVDLAADQGLIDTLIREATRAVEKWTGQQLRLATYRVKLSQWPCDYDPIRLPLPPLSSVTSIAYLDADGASQTWDATEYEVNTDPWPGEVQLAYGKSWPAVRGVDWPITVTFVAGRGSAAAVDDDIKGAIRALVGHWLDNPNAVVTGTIATELPVHFKDILAANRFTDFDYVALDEF